MSTDHVMATTNLYYYGGLLVEAINAFQADLLKECDFAAKVFIRPSYTRMVQHAERFEQMALAESKKS